MAHVGFSKKRIGEGMYYVLPTILFFGDFLYGL